MSISKLLYLLVGFFLLTLAVIPAKASQPSPTFTFTFVGSSPYLGVDVPSIGGIYMVTISGTSQTIAARPDGTSNLENEDAFYTFGRNGSVISPPVEGSNIGIGIVGTSSHTNLEFLMPGPVPQYNSLHVYTFLINFGPTVADRNFQRLGGSNDSRDYDNRVVSGVAAPEPGGLAGLGLGSLFITGLVVRRYRTRPGLAQ